jgi:hypothetical protein
VSSFLDILNAVFKLGLPMAGVSWFLFHRLYGQGNIDRSADRKAIKTHVQSLKANFKAEKKSRKQADTKLPRSHADIVFDKWMWFGSGFYGLAALWTFAVIEVSDIFNFIFNFPGLGGLLSEGLIELIISMAINQVQNIVTAFVWFSFWDAHSIPLWVVIAYGGYWVGVEIARRELAVPVTWIDRLRALLKR